MRRIITTAILAAMAGLMAAAPTAGVLAAGLSPQGVGCCVPR